MANDTNTPPTSPPATPNFLVNWTLNFGHGLKADSAVTVPDPAVGNYTAAPIAGVVGPADDVASGLSIPSSPIDIGDGLVMAEDNTLGAYSPYEGRIYAAFVGYIDVTVDGFTNPTSNTDVFLTYSDNDGRTWSTPVEVNDDSGQVDGYSGGSETNANDEVDGNSQYAPEVAVDPTTGTVVLSWRDARDDPNNTLVATYIATSIDGGNTFAPKSTLTPSKLRRMRSQMRRTFWVPRVTTPRLRTMLPTRRMATVRRWVWLSMLVRSTRFGPAISMRPTL